MSNPEHVKILKQSSEVWNEWRKENPDITPELRGEDCNQMDLGGMNL